MRKKNPFDDYDEEAESFREDLKAFYQSTGNDFSATDEMMTKRGLVKSKQQASPKPAKKVELPKDWWRLSDKDTKILADAGIKVE